MSESTRASTAKKIVKTPMLRNVFIVSLVVTIAIPIFSAFWIIPAFTQQLISRTEDQAVRTATHVRSMIIPEKGDLKKESLSAISLDEIETVKRDLQLEKLKIFSKSGETIFSTHAKDIGEINKKDYFHNTVAKGNVFTKVARKDSRSLEGRVVTSDVVETYVPIMRNSTFMGAFEIYYDITDSKKKLDRLLTQTYSLLFGIAAILLLAVIVILFKASQNIIERDQASEALKQAHDNLEKRVEERTAELNRTNETLKAEIVDRHMVEDALRENEERYRGLVETSTDVIVSTNEKMQIIQWNEAAHRVFGYSEREALGRSIDILIPEKFQRDHIEGVNRFLETRRGRLIGKTVETEAIQKGGAAIPIELSLSSLRQKESWIFTAIIRDISEKKRYEVQLRQSQKMEVIGTLAGGVAHDLNNILFGIVSYPEMILMDLPEESPLRKPISTIQKSGEKAVVIVQDLLTLARRGVDVNEVVNLNHIVSEQLKSPEFEKLKSFNPDVRVEISLEEDLLNIKGSPVHLAKTVMNLLSNATEAMPEGGTIFIVTENRYVDWPVKGYDHVEEGDYAMVTVSDNGIGISSEDMEKIFDPFYTKKTMGRSGTGLGMAVVWGTVKDHRGYIDLESTKGKGTTFTLYFPVTREEAAVDKSQLSIEAYMGKGETILIIDDVEEQREIASGMLKKLGYSVTSVSGGEEAAEYMKNNTADLLVLDMIMDPGIDGLETYKRILKLHPGQKAIITSGSSETPRVKAAVKLGAGAYVKKPYLIEKIGTVVRSELEK